MSREPLYWRLELKAQEQYGGRDYVKFRLVFHRKEPVKVDSIKTGWPTPLGWENGEDYGPLTITGCWEVVVFVATNTPARYQMRVVWPKKPSFGDKLKQTFEELKTINRASLSEVRDVWTRPWGWYGEEIVESDLITNSAANTSPGR